DWIEWRARRCAAFDRTVAGVPPGDPARGDRREARHVACRPAGRGGAPISVSVAVEIADPQRRTRMRPGRASGYLSVACNTDHAGVGETADPTADDAERPIARARRSRRCHRGAPWLGSVAAGRRRADDPGAAAAASIRAAVAVDVAEDQAL